MLLLALNHFPGFKKEMKLYTISVSRWLDYLFNMCSFTRMKIRAIVKM